MVNDDVCQATVNDAWFTMGACSGLAMKNMNVLDRGKITVVSDQGALQ
ncbi:hypothetical protein ACFL3A_01195 [Pseudomonadota bacterium]